MRILKYADKDSFREKLIVVLLWFYIVLNSICNTVILFIFSKPEYVDKLLPEFTKLSLSQEIFRINQLLPEPITLLYIFLVLVLWAMLLNIGLIFVSNIARKIRVSIQKVWVLFALIMAAGIVSSLVSSQYSVQFSTIILLMAILLPPILILFILNNKATKKLYDTKIP